MKPASRWVVRHKVKPFVATLFLPYKVEIVILDSIDGLITNSFSNVGRGGPW